MESERRFAGSGLSSNPSAAFSAGVIFAMAFGTTRIVMGEIIDPLTMLLGIIGSSLLASATDRRGVAPAPIALVIVVAGVTLAVLA